jgi:hypothetical protein
MEWLWIVGGFRCDHKPRRTYRIDDQKILTCPQYAPRIDSLPAHPAAGPPELLK